MIRKVPDKNQWVLRSKKTGKVLGVFKSIEDAIVREQQIQYFKNKQKYGW